MPFLYNILTKIWIFSKTFGKMFCGVPSGWNYLLFCQFEISAPDSLNIYFKMEI